mgnify:CR=1 FL=1
MRHSGGMQGVGMQKSGPATNLNGAPQRRGRETPVSQGSGLSIAALKQMNPCHFCNLFGHLKRECRLNPNRESFENQLFDQMQVPNNQMQVPNDQMLMTNNQMQSHVNMPQA